MRFDDMSRTEIEFLIDEWIHKERDRAELRQSVMNIMEKYK